MLDRILGGSRHGLVNKDHRSSGFFGFEEQKEFESHEQSDGGGYFGRQAHYNHMRLPANHGRPLMSHMTVLEEEDSDSDVEDFFESSRSHHTTALPHLNHQQPPHLNFMHSPPVALPHQNGTMGNGWPGRHEDAHHGGHGMQYHGGHKMQLHDMHGLQHHGEHKMQHHDGQGMQLHEGHKMQLHDGYGMQHRGGHGMQHHDGHKMQLDERHGMQHHGGHEMHHHDRLMAPQVAPQHVYVYPIQGRSGGRTKVLGVSENWPASNSSGGHHKVSWGSKGL